MTEKPSISFIHANQNSIINLKQLFCNNNIMAKLTGQQVSDIGNSSEFINRVSAVVKVKAQ